jgi:hypothetical protein
MIVVKILGWHPERAWTSFSSYHPDDFMRRLTTHTDLTRLEIKRLAEEVRKQTCHKIQLAKAKDSFGATSIQSFLESLGAEVEIEDE